MKKNSDEIIVKRFQAEIDRLKKEVRYYKYDHLTGLSLRSDFEGMIGDLWYEHVVNGNRFIYAIVDINGLKAANTAHGHKHGDALIVTITDQLKSVFEDSFIYRVGGDEFCIVKRGNGIKDFIKRLKSIQSIEYGVVHVDTTTKCKDEEALHQLVDDIMMKKKLKKRRRSSDEIQQ